MAPHEGTPAGQPTPPGDLRSESTPMHQHLKFAYAGLSTSNRRRLNADSAGLSGDPVADAVRGARTGGSAALAGPRDAGALPGVETARKDGRRRGDIRQNDEPKNCEKCFM